MAEREQGTREPGDALAGAERLDRVLLGHHARFLDLRRAADGQPSRGGGDASVRIRSRAREGRPGRPGPRSGRLVQPRAPDAAIDAARRRGAERRALEHHGREQANAGWDDELRTAVCACVHDVLPALKPEYAGVVRAVDLEERPLASVAAGHGITMNNATVRLHRARKALKNQLLRTCGACAAHGCLDCQCRTASRPAAPSRLT